MSSTLAPSQSTVYVSNLPFSLTNSDIYKVFEKHGKIVKVTIVKNKARKSTGVAFILFLRVEDARNCANQVNNSEIFGRTVKASIAKDNGRSTEFIRKRSYEDKSACYECGGAGHLSYVCPHNVLGVRTPPPKKERKRKKRHFGDDTQKSSSRSQNEDFESDSEVEDRSSHPDHGESLKKKRMPPIHDSDEETEEEMEPDFETLSAAIQLDREKAEKDGTYSELSAEQGVAPNKRKKIHRNSYFSDEEDLSD